MSITRQEAYKYYVNKIRHITEGSECEACRGVGHHIYSDGLTWRKAGVATQAFQEDICDHCWGSGDKHRPWTDIRAIENKFKVWEEDQVLDYLHRKLGLSYDTFKFAVSVLVKECGKQERKRALPEDRPAEMDGFWWSHTWHSMSSMLQRLVSHERRNNSV